ncbi:unnamed protein product [Phyllotreta striolata]|uniref:CLIP domain-containing serine protease n=1 Tax=Phyllotreta striolata TaxID=444603 RepID=A0A9N9XJS7_PHYSR|nr:unnamed protein product [Phyllotreta striolata]
MNFWICLVCLVFLHNVVAQIPEGTPCYTSRNEYGLCINIRNCEFMIRLLRTRSRDADTVKYLRASTCGYDGNLPMVCCPQDASLNDLNSNEGLEERAKKNKGDTENAGDAQLNGPQCGISNTTNYRVVGGVPAKLNEVPFIAILGYRNQKNPNTPKWLCGGSLITYRHVLTAAHCVNNRNDLYVVRLGDLNLFDDNDGAFPENIEISHSKVHENYSPVNYTNDIAIVTLQRRPKNPNVWPVCIPNQQPLISNNFVKYQAMVAGWGALYFNGPSSATLQLAQIPVVDQGKCITAFANKAVIDDRIICAGRADGKQDACQGDSGGPLFWGTISGEVIRYYQIGVVSYGFRCAEVGYPGVYTRVTKFINWIENNIK